MRIARCSMRCLDSKTDWTAETANRSYVFRFSCLLISFVLLYEVKEKMKGTDELKCQ
jgi:hypothetical protein